MYVEPGNLEKNLSHAEALIASAARNKANVVLIPEVMDLGWTHPSAKQFADSIPDGKEKLMGPYGEKAEQILYYTINPTPRPARGTGWYEYKGKE